MQSNTAQFGNKTRIRRGRMIHNVVVRDTLASLLNDSLSREFSLEVLELFERRVDVVITQIASKFGLTAAETFYDYELYLQLPKGPRT